MSNFDLQATCEWRPPIAIGSASERLERLKQLLGLANRSPVPVQAALLQSVECDGYVEDKYSLAVGEGVAAVHADFGFSWA